MRNQEETDKDALNIKKTFKDNVLNNLKLPYGPNSLMFFPFFEFESSSLAQVDNMASRKYTFPASLDYTA